MGLTGVAYSEEPEEQEEEPLVFVALVVDVDALVAARNSRDLGATNEYAATGSTRPIVNN